MLQRLVVGLLAVVLLALGGCSDDSSSADPPSPTPSTSQVSPSPTETESAETPEAFVRRWVEVSNEMENTGEATEFLSISMGCRACTEVADQVEGYFAAGGYVTTDGWDIQSISKTDLGPDKHLTATVTVDSAPTEYVESAGGKVQKLDGGRVIYLFTITKQSSAWNVADLEQQAQ